MRGTKLDLILNSVYGHNRHDSRSDAELLTAYLEQHDIAAFEALLIRHTPAVRVTCRGWLRSAADIDDAAQATFLVMVERARTIRDRAALGHWLCRVAANVARSSRRMQKVAAPLPEDLAGRTPADDGLRDLLAEEVGRLPEKYRMPVQLCYGVGLTTEEAAQRLGWPRGTVLTRLSWARKRLQKTLARHGIGAVVPSMLAASTTVNGQWVQATVLAAKAVRCGQSPAVAGVSERMCAIIKGVIRTMIWDKVKYPAALALLAACLLGFGLAQWAKATDGKQGKEPEKPPVAAVTGKEQKPPVAVPGGNDPAKPEEARPPVRARRSEAVIRLPVGTFVKEIEAEPYGNGRVTWTYEEDRVLGLIEGSAMGFEFTVATEAEISLSSTGTVYGVLTGVRLIKLKVPRGEEYDKLQPFVGLWPVVEPLVNEVCIDLPFSYHCRVQDDRIVISNFRILLSGPNPLGKLGGLVANGDGDTDAMLKVLACFQAFGTALEGTYKAGEPNGKFTPKSQPIVPKLRGEKKFCSPFDSPLPVPSQGSTSPVLPPSGN
jgi:RNA polymerase sigma factor (sigma-70 family)